jgi:hypothetical protein
MGNAVTWPLRGEMTQYPASFDLSGPPVDRAPGVALLLTTDCGEVGFGYLRARATAQLGLLQVPLVGAGQPDLTQTRVDLLFFRRSASM